MCLKKKWEFLLSRSFSNNESKCIDQSVKWISFPSFQFFKYLHFCSGQIMKYSYGYRKKKHYPTHCWWLKIFIIHQIYHKLLVWITLLVLLCSVLARLAVNEGKEEQRDLDRKIWVRLKDLRSTYFFFLTLFDLLLCFFVCSSCSIDKGMFFPAKLTLISGQEYFTNQRSGHNPSRSIRSRGRFGIGC